MSTKKKGRTRRAIATRSRIAHSALPKIGKNGGALELEKARSIQQEICQFSIRAAYARNDQSHPTKIQRHLLMMRRIIERMFELSGRQNQEFAKFLGVPPQRVPDFFRGTAQKQMAFGISKFKELVRHIILGANPASFAHENPLIQVANEIDSFFMRDHSGSEIPKYFLPERCFINSPYSPEELALAIRWIGRQAAYTKRRGRLVLVPKANALLLQSDTSIESAIIDAAKADHITVEFVYSKASDVTHHAIEALKAKAGDHAPILSTPVTLEQIRGADDNCFHPFFSYIYRSHRDGNSGQVDESLLLIRPHCGDQGQPVSWRASTTELKLFHRGMENVGVPLKESRAVQQDPKQDDKHYHDMPARARLEPGEVIPILSQAKTALDKKPK